MAAGATLLAGFLCFLWNLLDKRCFRSTTSNGEARLPREPARRFRRGLAHLPPWPGVVGRRNGWIALALLTLLLGGCTGTTVASQHASPPSSLSGIHLETVVSGLDQPVDAQWAPDGL